MVGGDSVVLTGPCTMDTVYGDLEMGLQLKLFPLLLL